MLDFQAARWLMAGEVAGQAGNDHPTGIPTGVFPDGRRTDQHRRRPARGSSRFCEAIGRKDWLDDPDNGKHQAWPQQRPRGNQRGDQRR